MRNQIPRTNSKSARRVAVALAAVASLLLAGCSATSGPSKSGGGGQTIKIGIVGPYGTSLLGQNAEQFLDGAQLGIEYINDHGGLPAGDKVQLVTGNDGNTPADGAAAVRGLLGQGVKLFVATSTTAVTEAWGGAIDSAGAVAIHNSSDPSLTGSARPFKNLYRVGVSSDMMAQAVGLTLGPKFQDTNNIDMFGYDYVQGHATWNALDAAFKDAGLKFGSKTLQYVPTTQTSYLSEITTMNGRIDPTKKNLLAMLTFGPGYVTFIKQAQSLGMLTKYQAVVSTAEYYLEAAAMKGTAPQVWNSFDVCDYNLFKNPVMDWLLTKAKSKTGFEPNDWSVQGFDSMITMLAAIKDSGSSDPKAVMGALNGMNMNLAVGKAKMGAATHQGEVGVPVCETVGDPSQPDGVKMLQGVVVPYSELPHPVK